MRAAFLALAFALASGAACADTPVALFKSFSGKVNFVGTQVSMRTKDSNPHTCLASSPNKKLDATLAGIPATATIVSAQLYWAGSSSSADTAVEFDGAGVTAPAARQYKSATIGAGLDYFSGAADVTAQVAAKRNGTYTFSGLSIDNGSPYCAAGGVVGGFALLVVYTDPSEQSRLLNLYEGFQFFRNNGLTTTIGNFRTPSPLGAATARVGHLSWSGEAATGAGEDLLLNGAELVDALNPSHNQFNSSSNINNDGDSLNLDFDAYTAGSGAIGAGQTSATMRYQTGQDLVLLSAQIIAMPNVPGTDLSIAMSRNTALVPNRSASYTLSVSNNGPNADTGPVAVVDTLPAGLTFVSAGGTGWSCAASSGTVTCTHAASIAVGENVAPITVTVLVSGSGTLTNTASVSGALFDNASANNTAADSAATETAAEYAFTDVACVSGQPFGAALQPCKDIGGTPQLAGAARPLYVTVLAAGVPTRLSADKTTTVAMSFALSCVNPATNAGVKASYAGVELPLCTAGGAAPAAWSAQVNMVFAAGAASAAASPGLQYADVGKLRLYLRDNAGMVAASLPFVVKPASLAITAVLRSGDGFANPQAANGAGNGFARVGEAFTVKAAALTTAGATAPNFGSEGARVVLDWQRGGDGPVQAAMLALPALAGDFGSVAGGVFTGTAFSVDEAGILAVTPRLAGNDYLGAGGPAATATNVGRFYPDHFDTSTASTLACLPHMGCPTDVSGAAYAGQPFAVTVKPMSVQGGELRNYNGVLARAVTLSAYSQPGGATANPSSGFLSNNVIPAASMTANQPITALPGYGWLHRFSNSAPRARDWVGPTAVYLRAGADENIAGGGAVKVSSLRASGSVEGGLTIISGRLALDSPHGSELVKMPVRAEAQYWAATGRWETSATDNISTLQTGGTTFGNCLKALGPPCNTALLGVTANNLLTLKNGVTTFWLKAPGAGNNGSAEFQMNNPGWLTSTIGRAVFGVYKSPLIYLREVY